MKYINVTRKGVTYRAKVDDIDYEKVSKHTWYYTGGYAQAVIDDKKIGMHRYIMNTPKGLVTDHLNHDTLDNRRSNLRICTHAENMANRKNGIKYLKITERGSIKKMSLCKGKYVYYYGELRNNKKRYTTVTCKTIEQAQGALKQLVKQVLNQ